MFTALQNLDRTTLLTAAAVFGLVFALWMLGLLVWSSRRSDRQAKLKERLADFGDFKSDPRTLRLWHEGDFATMSVIGRIRKLPMRVRFSQMCRDAGWSMPPRIVAAALVATIVFVFIALYVVTGQAFAALVSIPACSAGLWAWISHRIAKLQGIFERQLVDGLELSARALRAGHPLLAAFKLIADEIPAPVGTVFSEICQQQEMGIPMEETLRRAALVHDNGDMKLFAATLAINLRTGGNLAEVVMGLAFVIRQRMRVNRKFQSLIAQTQFSKRVLVALPLVVFVLINLLNAEYMQPLYTTRMGNILLASASAALLMGWWMMNKMASLRA